VRHTSAAHLLQAGVDISIIALWLGHESIETVKGRRKGAYARVGVSGNPGAIQSGQAADLAWFPAWVLTDKPGLASLLREAQPSRQTAPERATRLLLQILGLERQGNQHELVERRKALRDLHGGLYAAYMKTR
jgi:hypothetical protein